MIHLIQALFLLAAPATEIPKARLSEIETRNIDADLQRSARQILNDLERSVVDQDAHLGVSNRVALRPKSVSSKNTITPERYQTPISVPTPKAHETPLK